jgi:glycosyltransferase involved in cell wall biosynthesis
MHFAIRSGLIAIKKAEYANNTIDTESIKGVYQFRPPPSKRNILFIGRLVQNKRIDLLIKYYIELKKRIPGLKLTIIGDGPEANKVKTAAKMIPGVEWKGAIVVESEIAPIMESASLVINLGHSGLSIVHAFAYGRPYITSLEYDTHPPEISYLKDEKNGLKLNGPMLEDVERIAELLGNKKRLEHYCQQALLTANQLSIDNWCCQITAALN